MWWLLQNTIIAAALAAGVLLVCRCRRIGPAGRHLLWLIVLVKLVTPPLVSWPWAIPQWDERTYWRAGWRQPPEDSGRSRSRLASGRNPDGDSASPENGTVIRSETFVVTIPAKKRGKADPAATPAAVPTPESDLDAESVRVAESPHPRPLSWGRLSVAFWLLAVWAGGSTLYLLLQLIRIRRMSSRLRTAEPPPGWLDDEIRRWAEQLRIVPPKTCIVSGFSSPFLWAYRSVRLVWPRELTSEATLDAWRGVIVHELAHLKRRDHWVGWLELAAGCVWWWNPLFWYVRNQIRENAELACDAWVVETLPGGRKQYAEALLTVCEHFSRPVVPSAAIGIGGARRNLERRLTMILKDRVPFRVSRGLLCAAGVLALLILPGWAQPPGDGGSSDGLPAATGNPVKAAPTIPRAGSTAPSRPTHPIAAAQPGSDSGNPMSRRKPLTAAERLKQLEQQILQLQNQLRGLRSRTAKPPLTDEPFPASQGFKPLSRPVTRIGSRHGSVTVSADGTVYDPYGSLRREVLATRTITLQRTTYRLPASRAKALEAFLKQHIKAEVLTIEIGIAPAASRRPGGALGPMDPMGAGPMPRTDGPMDGGLPPRGAFRPADGAGGGAARPMGIVRPGVPDAGTVLLGAAPMGVGPKGPSTVPVITITTTPDVQKAIAGIIALMRKDELPSAGTKKVGSEPNTGRGFESSGGFRNTPTVPGGNVPAGVPTKPVPARN